MEGVFPRKRRPQRSTHRRCGRWVPWFYLGDLVSEDVTRLVAVDAEGFAKAVGKCWTTQRSARNMVVVGTHFCWYFFSPPAACGFDCYWVGSLDFNFFGTQVGFFTKPASETSFSLIVV